MSAIHRPCAGSKRTQSYANALTSILATSVAAAFFAYDRSLPPSLPRSLRFPKLNNALQSSDKTQSCTATPTGDVMGEGWLVMKATCAGAIVKVSPAEA
eukprot:3595151-Pleurochrysis_carterae.AAC.1